MTQIQQQPGTALPWAKPMRLIKTDHDYSLAGLWDGPKVITQSMFLRMGEYVVAIGELNRRNRWRDEEIEAFAEELRIAWNAHLKALANARQGEEG